MPMLATYNKHERLAQYNWFFIVFILLSGVDFINPFNSAYIKTELISHEFIFNNVISTVQKLQRHHFLKYYIA